MQQSLGRIKGERSEVYCYPESMPAGIFTCSHIIFAMVYSFYFLLVGSREMNAIVFGWNKGERSEVYCLLGRISHQKKMIYCDNIIINLSCKVIACGIILSSVKLEKKVQHSENDIRISHNLLSPSTSPSQRLLYSFLLEPKHRKKKYYHIPDAASERV